MPDRVHPLMHAVQPAGGCAPGHCLAAQPEPDELGKRDDPMLALGKVGEQDIQRLTSTFVNSWLTNVRLTLATGGHASSVPHRGAPVGYGRYETVTTP
jgi:hypothetical protein